MSTLNRNENEFLLEVAPVIHASRVLLRGGRGVDGAAVVPGERPRGVRVGRVEVIDVVLTVLLALDHFPRSVTYK